MKLSKISLGLCALISANALAATVPITNADIDAQATVDGDIRFAVQGWVSQAGATGLYNPPGDVFTGEAGDGAHKNTLFLFQEAKISQTLNTTLEANTDYVLEFDVGERLDYSIPNYTVTVKADDEILLQAINPLFPSTKGTFSRAQLSFGSEAIAGVGSNIVIEIESEGDGQAHFDNFSLTSTPGSSSGAGGIAGLGYTTVAYGLELAGNSSTTQVYATQESENSLPYMVEEPNSVLTCNQGSTRIVVGVSGTAGGYESIQCVISHQQP